MDPDGCYMSNEMLNTLHHDLGLNTEVIPGEAPWKLSITGVIMRLVKRTAHLYALDQGRDASCQECLLQAVMAHSRLLKHGGYTPLQLLFGHEPAPIEGETLDDEQQGRSITESMAERLARQQSAMKAWLQAEAESRVERAQNRRTRTFLHWPSGTRVCYWRARCSECGFLAYDTTRVHSISEQTQGCLVGSCHSSGSGKRTKPGATRRSSWHSLDRGAGSTHAMCT